LHALQGSTCGGLSGCRLAYQQQRAWGADLGNTNVHWVPEASQRWKSSRVGHCTLNKDWLLPAATRLLKSLAISPATSSASRRLTVLEAIDADNFT
jgi:hypothetical protein